MSTPQQNMGFMPPAYYGTTGGLSYGSSPATSYNSIPQHAQDVNNFDRSSDEAAAAEAGDGDGEAAKDNAVVGDAVAGKAIISQPLAHCSMMHRTVASEHVPAHGEEKG